LVVVLEPVLLVLLGPFHGIIDLRLDFKLIRFLLLYWWLFLNLIISCVGHRSLDAKPISTICWLLLLAIDALKLVLLLVLVLYVLIWIVHIICGCWWDLIGLYVDAHAYHLLLLLNESHLFLHQWKLLLQLLLLSNSRRLQSFSISCQPFGWFISREPLRR